MERAPSNSPYSSPFAETARSYTARRHRQTLSFRHEVILSSRKFNEEAAEGDNESNSPGTGSGFESESSIPSLSANSSPIMDEHAIIHRFTEYRKTSENVSIRT
jgi:hypothetical protein